VLFIDCTIDLASNFILEKAVNEGYGLPLSEIVARQTEIELTIDASTYQCPDKHLVTGRHIRHNC